MELNGLGRNVESGGNFLRGLSLRDQLQDFALALCQRAAKESEGFFWGSKLASRAASSPTSGVT